MKILFMGTPDFAVPSLEALIAAGHQVIGVVTQPDRPKGRGKKIAFSPVKEAALKHNLPVFQPQKVKTTDFYQLLEELSPDVIAVVAFGQLLSKEILFAPPYGCINVHASLLPLYRGAAPLHWAVIKGEKETGVTTMHMNEGLDTGDMIFKGAIPVADSDNTGLVHDKLAQVGGELLVATLKALEEGVAPRVPQEEQNATYAPLLNKDHELINWQRKVEEVHNQVRGMNPWPGAYTHLEDKRLKVRATQIFTTENKSSAKPGEIIEVLPQQGFVVQTGQGQLLITEIQLEGSKAVSSPEFLRGRSLEKGTILA